MPIIIKRSATKTLRKVDATTRARLLRAIDGLAEGGPADVVRLVNYEGYRMRVGDWRVLFEIDGDDFIIHAIETRGAAYRR